GGQVTRGARNSARNPRVLVLDDGLRRKVRGEGFDAAHFFDGGADGHELEQVVVLVDVGLDADDVVGADGGGFVADQADGVLAGVVDQCGERLDLAAAHGGEGGFETADDAERVDRGAEDELEREIANVDEVP